MLKLTRKNIISAIAITTALALVILTIISSYVYNKSLPKITTVQIKQNIYNITRQFSGEFSYTALQGYSFLYDIKIDEILVTEGGAVKKGDKLLKISFTEKSLIEDLKAKIEDNNRALSTMNMQYQLDKSRYSPKAYQARLEAELTQLEQSQKELWYDTNGGIDLAISVLENEIAILNEEKNLLVNNALNMDDLAIMQLDIDLQGLLQSIDAEQDTHKAELLRKQYDLKVLERDILMQANGESKRAMEINKKTSAIHDKTAQIELLRLKKTGISSLSEQIAAKQAELAAFKKTGLSDDGIKLEQQLNDIEVLTQQTQALANSIGSIEAIEKADGYAIADENFTVHKINVGIDTVHKAHESVFTHTTEGSMPCFKWSTPKDAFQANFGIGGEVNVKYANTEGEMYETFKISSKMQLEATTEYIAIADDISASEANAEITMSYQKDEYVSYLPKTAIHTNDYGETVVYAIQEKDSVFTRESFVVQQPVQILAQDDRYCIVKILSDTTKNKSYAARISMPLTDGDIVKIVKEIKETDYTLLQQNEPTQSGRMDD